MEEKKITGTFNSLESLGEAYGFKKVKLTASQKRVLSSIKFGLNTFITGVAGTGKTWLLKQLSEMTGRPVELFATSGMTAINLGGITISSNNALGLYGYNRTDEEIKEHNWKGKYSLDSIIVLDEIGFISVEQFRQIEYALRCIGNEDEFCGGFQVVLSGDFRQMPPMYWGTPLEGSEILENFQEVELIECVRQQDDLPFFNQLMKIRKNGITDGTVKFLAENHNSEIFDGPIITATRSLMDELNAKIEIPEDFQEFSCEPKDENRLYGDIKLWEGMPVIICANNNREGYANGDMGKIIDFIPGDPSSSDWDEQDDRVIVELARTGYNVSVKLHSRDYHYFEAEKQKVFVKKINGKWHYLPFSEKFSEKRNWISFSKKTLLRKRKGIHYMDVKVQKNDGYQFMPILPAYHLSIRRIQGLTLQKGILHKSILEAEKYSKDFVSIQYVALSRFQKIKQCYVEGAESEALDLGWQRKAS